MRCQESAGVSGRRGGTDDGSEFNIELAEGPHASSRLQPTPKGAALRSGHRNEPPEADRGDLERGTGATCSRTRALFPLPRLTIYTVHPVRAKTRRTT